jgi:hypothetical protein
MVRHEIWANPFAYYDLPSHAELMAEEARYEQERIRLYGMSAAQSASAQGDSHHADFYLSQQERERKQHEEVEAAMVSEAEAAARQAEEQARLWERETLANL